jgi:hypothetical protein
VTQPWGLTFTFVYSDWKRSISWRKLSLVLTYCNSYLTDYIVTTYTNYLTVFRNIISLVILITFFTALLTRIVFYIYSFNIICTNYASWGLIDSFEIFYLYLVHRFFARQGSLRPNDLCSRIYFDIRFLFILYICLQPTLLAVSSFSVICEIFNVFSVNISLAISLVKVKGLDMSCVLVPVLKNPVLTVTFRSCFCRNLLLQFQIEIILLMIVLSLCNL